MPGNVQQLLVRFPRPEDRDAFLRQVRSLSAAEVGVLMLKPGLLVEVWTGTSVLEAVRRLVARDHGMVVSQN